MALTECWFGSRYNIAPFSGAAREWSKKSKLTAPAAEIFSTSDLKIFAVGISQAARVVDV
jgi:hypothetical protein